LSSQILIFSNSIFWITQPQLYLKIAKILVDIIIFKKGFKNKDITGINGGAYEPGVASHRIPVQHHVNC
jgi:hypothetical protein